MIHSQYLLHVYQVQILPTRQYQFYPHQVQHFLPVSQPAWNLLMKHRKRVNHPVSWVLLLGYQQQPWSYVELLLDLFATKKGGKFFGYTIQLYCPGISCNLYFCIAVYIVLYYLYSTLLSVMALQRCIKRLSDSGKMCHVY